MKVSCASTTWLSTDKIWIESVGENDAFPDHGDDGDLGGFSRTAPDFVEANEANKESDGRDGIAACDGQQDMIAGYQDLVAVDAARYLVVETGDMPLQAGDAKRLLRPPTGGAPKDRLGLAALIGEHRRLRTAWRARVPALFSFACRRRGGGIAPFG